jgi:hypothetical protein
VLKQHGLIEEGVPRDHVALPVEKRIEYHTHTVSESLRDQSIECLV